VQQALERPEMLTAQPSDSAPEPDDLHSTDGRQVKGNTADPQSTQRDAA
jgi:hypothetical protein